MATANVPKSLAPLKKLTKSIEIEVKQEYIDAACHGSDNCPIALAFQARDVIAYVSIRSLLLSRATYTASIMYNTSKAMRKWLISYDDGEDVKPTRFTVKRTEV